MHDSGYVFTGVAWLLLVSLHPHAAAGAFVGCCFFLAYPNASQGFQRLLYAVFSWGLGYAAGVFWYGEGPPYSPKAMLISAAAAAVAVLLFVACGGVIRKEGDLPLWLKSTVKLLMPFKRGGNNDAS